MALEQGAGRAGMRDIRRGHSVTCFTILGDEGMI